MQTEQMSQGLAVVGYIAPISHSVATDVTITNIDMKLYKRILVILQNGVMGASGTHDMKLRESKTSGGTYQDITSAAITQLVKASDDGHIACIEIRDDQRSEEHTS